MHSALEAVLAFTYLLYFFVVHMLHSNLNSNASSH